MGGVKKQIKRLLVPYYITAISILIFTFVRAFIKNDFLLLQNKVVDLLVVSHNSGPLWFLWALFWLKFLFVQCARFKKWSLLISLGVSIGGVIVYEYYNLPLCFTIALCDIIFYAVGFYYRRYDVSIWMVLLCVVCWPFSIIYSHLNTGYIDFGIYPLSVFGACGGTCMIYILSAGIAKIQAISNVLQWIGLNSMSILCFHAFDLQCCWVSMFFVGLLKLHIPYVVLVSMRIGFVVLFVWIYKNKFYKYFPVF